ncbi:MAG: Xaa-Pro aminopeptidase [Planctomycetaceae bacterium]
MTVSLERMTWPAMDVPLERPVISHNELLRRCDALYERAGCDWVCVYGDKEHYANLLYLIDFDPRFEEALLLLGPSSHRYLVAGSEGMIYGAGIGVCADLVHYQPFSLMGQPLSSPSLDNLLRDVGMRQGDRVGMAGWKWQESAPDRPSYLPAVIVDAVEGVCGSDAVDVTRVLLDPGEGLRVTASATQIAQFEWGASRASRGIMTVVRDSRAGVTEHELASLLGYAGEPLSTHFIISSSSGTLNGLRSATSRTVNDGDAVVAGVGYWGGLCARAGLMTDTPPDGFITELVEPYFAAIAAWWAHVAIDVSAGELHSRALEPLQGATFGPLLNPGHLTSHDEWLHGFTSAGSGMRIRSGMTFQADIIPSPVRDGWAINCEDTLAIAGPELRGELRTGFPDVWSRIEQRRSLMASLGIVLHEEVLPLSTLPGFLPPLWADHELICTIRT